MEMTILQFFESIRCGFATWFACLFSLFGETTFLVALICAVYWLLDKKLGERLIVTSFSSMAVNSAAKEHYNRLRPYLTGFVSRVEIDNPFLSTLDLNPTQSFPSGHSQMSAGIFFTTAFHYRKKWIWLVAPLLTLGVMISRLYFGVHYPSDVLVGAAMGIAFAYFWALIYKFCENKVFHVFAAFALLSIVLCFFFPTKEQIEICACAVSAAICLPLEHKYLGFKDTKDWKKIGLRALIGFACVGFVYLGVSVLPFKFLEHHAWKFIKYFLTIATATLLVPYLFKKMKIEK